ncbi:hypothetical protein H4R34_000360 [Dimargaris verticillata]|uniref:Uncharacterized protein n=1 Tax=Dimargaris verticillata TaxID=2761393 RepID=A0A9W8EES3_9FUNG|nr:hypothetical protein H4R34_000360 [Dimargaris verticillata]
MIVNQCPLCYELRILQLKHPAHLTMDHQVLDQVEVAVKRIRESMAMPALPENPHLPSTVQVYPLCLQLTLEDNADSDIEWTLEDSMAFIKAPAAPITLSNNVYTSI